VSSVLCAYAVSKMYECGGAVQTRLALVAVAVVLKTNGGTHESEKVVNKLLL
jgi:hypothetical protein